MDMKQLYFCLMFFGVSTAFAQVPDLLITEINYHSDSTTRTGDWFELYNAGAVAVDLSGFRIRDDNALNLFIVPQGVSIPSGGYLVFCEDTVKFDQYHSIPNRIGNLPFGLGNMSDSIRIFDALNQPVIRMGYVDSTPWPKGADGYGRTLELIPGSTDLNNPASWRTGCVLGSPGGPFVPCSLERIVVSEINYHSPPTDDAGDWFELHNLDATPKSLAGWRIRDRNNLNEFIFPVGTSIGGNGYLVVYNNAQLFNQQHPSIPNKVGPFPFGLGNSGDAIRLYDQSDRIVFSVRYNDKAPWPTEADGNGYTLEALPDFDPSRDVNSYTSWTFHCYGGSPGRANPDDCFASTEEVDLNAFVHIYPNPIVDQFHIRVDALKNYVLKIQDALGRMVYESASFSEYYVLNAKEILIPGVYFALLVDEAGSQPVVRKIIVP